MWKKRRGEKETKFVDERRWEERLGRVDRTYIFPFPLSPAHAGAKEVPKDC